MKKIKTLFKKDPNDLSRVINEIDPENMWVFEGKAIATRKFDGTAVSIIKNELYKRYDCKLYTGKQLKKRNYYLDLLEVGVIVSKVSNKPFENGEKQAVIKEFSTHPITNVDSAILSCGSNIDLRQLKPVGVLPSKYYKPVPEGAIPCQDPDSVTGHWPHWVKCDRNNPEDKWHWEGYDNLLKYYTDALLDGIPNVKIPDGTYELIGEKIQGNPEKVEGHFLTKHGWHLIDWEGDYSFENVKRIIEHWPFEGIVFHHKDENDDRMCKIRKTDFGLTR